MNKAVFNKVLYHIGALNQLDHRISSAFLREDKEELEKAILALDKLVSGIAFEHGVALPPRISNEPDERNETKR